MVPQFHVYYRLLAPIPKHLICSPNPQAHLYTLYGRSFITQTFGLQAAEKAVHGLPLWTLLPPIYPLVFLLVRLLSAYPFPSFQARVPLPQTRNKPNWKRSPKTKQRRKKSYRHRDLGRKSRRVGLGRALQALYGGLVIATRVLRPRPLRYIIISHGINASTERSFSLKIWCRIFRLEDSVYLYVDNVVYYLFNLLLCFYSNVYRLTYSSP